MHIPELFRFFAFYEYCEKPRYIRIALEGCGPLYKPEVLKKIEKETLFLWKQTALLCTCNLGGGRNVYHLAE